MPMPVTRLGVLGWPVAHSRSPAMHNAALAAVGLTDWRYQLLPVPPELFGETVRALPDAGFRGVNVTIPHKQAALALATTPTRRALAIGAANTLLFESGTRNRVGSAGEVGDGSAGEIRADNTDAPALIDALPFDPAGRSALVMGAGGSARAAIWALIDAGAGHVYVWNRSPERARRLAEEFGASATGRAERAELLINCTSIGLKVAEDPFTELPLTADGLRRYECVVDLVYAERQTRLVQAARERRVRVIDGRQLLVAQGALSFGQFTGHEAPAELMRAAVRE